MHHNTPITNETVGECKEGFAFSMAEQIQRQSKQSVAFLAPRSKTASPVIIGHHFSIPDGPNSTHSAFPIKASGHDVVALPALFEFAFPAAKIVLDDVLELYGPHKFLNAEIEFIFQRSSFEKDKPYRSADFDHWHTHDHGRKPVDYSYQFTTSAGTEFIAAGTREDAFVLSAPTNTLLRFGGEVPHRSPQSTSESTLRRAWGAFLVYDKHYLSNNGIPNPILRGENIERALEAGENCTVGSIKKTSRPFDLTRYANKFIEPDVPEGLESLFPNGVRFGFHSKIDGVYSAKLSLQDAGVTLSIKRFDGSADKISIAQDRWQIQQALMAHGAHPIEPINA